MGMNWNMEPTIDYVYTDYKKGLLSKSIIQKLALHNAKRAVTANVIKLK